jgi:hypothetical protein
MIIHVFGILTPLIIVGALFFSRSFGKGSAKLGGRIEV